MQHFHVHALAQELPRHSKLVCTFHCPDLIRKASRARPLKVRTSLLCTAVGGLTRNCSVIASVATAPGLAGEIVQDVHVTGVSGDLLCSQ